jgi:hypothetical protein
VRSRTDRSEIACHKAARRATLAGIGKQLAAGKAGRAAVKSAGNGLDGNCDATPDCLRDSAFFLLPGATLADYVAALAIVRCRAQLGAFGPSGRAAEGNHAEETHREDYGNKVDGTEEPEGRYAFGDGSGSAIGGCDGDHGGRRDCSRKEQERTLNGRTERCGGSLGVAGTADAQADLVRVSRKRLDGRWPGTQTIEKRESR